MIKSDNNSGGARKSSAFTVIRYSVVLPNFSTEFVARHSLAPFVCPGP